MSDLTKASEALLASAVYIVNELDWKCVPLDGLAEKLLAIEAAVRSDTLADVAARLPEALTNAVHRADHGQPCPAWTRPKSNPWEVCDCWVKPREQTRTTAILAHLFGGTDR